MLVNIDVILSFLDTMQSGELFPLVMSVIFMLLRYLTQAESYRKSFQAVGWHGQKWREYIILIFSLVFINTFCLFSGATGLAFIVDDAYRAGSDMGKASSGAILSQIGFYAAVLGISIIGFLTMFIIGNINWLFVTGGLLLMGALMALSSLFFIGHFKPIWLFYSFEKVQRTVARVLKIFKKELPVNWANTLAKEFIDSANLLSPNISGTIVSIVWAILSAILNMLCLIAIAYAFGFEDAPSMIAAFALSAISVILSPTPQGVGVVEAAIAAVAIGGGCDPAIAAAISLVYRGIMFWIPFLIGAVVLSQSGFFKKNKTLEEIQKDKDTGWILGVLVIIIGLVNIIAVVLPSFLEPYRIVTQYIIFTSVLSGTGLILLGVFLIVLGVG
ncbi:MAG: flippase-like domain-containing protein, partial [Eggerthellaceae bacterium]|nr:flippase-like domain-containing protein [Eggerthellaceae bacterium]